MGGPCEKIGFQLLFESVSSTIVSLRYLSGKLTNYFLPQSSLFTLFTGPLYSNL